MTIKKEPIIPGAEQESTTSEHQIRLEKLKTLEQEHIKPWPEARKITATCAQVHKEFDPLILGANGEGKAYAVAGRIRIIRHHGKASFVVIQDQSGQVATLYQAG